MGQWRFAHETWRARAIDVRRPADGVVEVAVTGEITAGATSRCDLAWTFFASGDLRVSMKWMPSYGPIPEPPRFGMQTTLRAGFDQLRWLGKGPHETYWDRQDARVGLYEGTVREQAHPYIKPQETGNKEGVRWIALTDAQGRGLLAVGEPLLSANASHHTTEDLFCATQLENSYPYQLPDRDTVTLDLDLKQRGVGGDNSWGALPHADHRIAVWPTGYRYRLRVLRGREDVARLARTLPGG
jgi:beta-galactosidase